MLGRVVELAGAAFPQFVRQRVPLDDGAPRIRVPVDSYYVEPARALLDPVVPREGMAWFDGREPPMMPSATSSPKRKPSTCGPLANSCSAAAD